MAKVVSDEVWAGVAVRHPWDKWFDGQTWQIDARDFTGSVRSMRQLAYGAAKLRGLKLRIRTNGDSLILKVTGPRKDRVTA